MLIWIDEQFPLPDGAWTQHGYKICVRKFVTWMRRKYGYPETYSNRSKLIELLSLSKYAYEVSRMDIKKPNKLRDAHTIPTDQEMEFLCNAAANPRDKAYIEMLREHGERIGGLGTRQIKHVKFDQIGAVVTIHDKTFKGEPVRYIASTIYLRQWLEKHPFKNDPEDVDEYLQKKAGLEIGERDNPNKLVKCVRCKEINSTKSTYCLKCGLPMSGTAVIEMEDMMKKMDVVLGRLMQDKEFAEMFDKKVTQLEIDQK